MGRRKQLAALSTAVTLILTTFATKADASTIIGQGGMSCGTWTADHQQDSLSAAGEGAWLAGYLTASNEHAPAHHDFLTNTDFAALSAWMTTYCAAHPLDMIVDASRALTLELSRRASGH